MNASIFSVTETAIGDTICAMAAVQYIVARHRLMRNADVFYLHTNNTETQLLLAPDNVRSMREVKGFLDDTWLYGFNVGEQLKTVGRYAHPFLQYLDQVAWDRPSEPFVPRLNVLPNVPGDSALPMFDILIAPYCKDRNRELYYSDGAYYTQAHRIWTLCEALHEKVPTALIGILGSVDDNRMKAGKITEWASWLQPVFGYYLSNVACMMRAAKVIITVDSGPSRLAWAAGCANKQVILAPPEAYLPFEWVHNPGATMVHDWDIESIVDATAKLYTKEGCVL